MITLRHKRLQKAILKYPSKKEARLAAGYSLSYSLSGHIDKTKGAQIVVKSTLQALEIERDRIIRAMNTKDLLKEEYATLSLSLDRVQKQVQLISGKATDHIAVVGVNIDVKKENNAGNIS